MPTDMIEVRCPECDESLGYQGEGEIDWANWRHNRCPVRLARKLGLSREDYEHALGIATVAISGAYPDFPNNLLAGKDEADFQAMRANIAAGVVLESLGVTGFTMGRVP
jgi:hypothetical protein